MDPFEMMFVPMILFMAIVAPIWIVMHYRSRHRSSQSLSDDERESLDQMLATVDKLNDRIQSLEAILDADHPSWREQSATRDSQ